MELFARDGFEGASLRDIVRQAGVNLSAVNYYFGTKEQLYREVIRQVLADSLRMQDWADQLAQREFQSAEEVAEFLDGTIRKLFLNYVGLDKPSWYGKLLNRALLEADPRVEATFLEAEQATQALLQRALPGFIPEKRMAEIELWIVSVFAQIHHYLMARNLVEKSFGHAAYDQAFLNQVASYVARNALLTLGLPAPRARENQE